MAVVDSPEKGGASAPGSIGPNGASNDSASESSVRSPVVVWCAKQVKFSSPCTRELFGLPACACMPMARFLSAGQTDPIQLLQVLRGLNDGTYNAFAAVSGP